MKNVLCAAAIAIALGASCKKESSPSASGAPPAPKQVVVGLVTDIGGRGDQSFNDSALRGLELWAAGQMYAGGSLRDATAAEVDTSIPPELKARHIAKVGIKPIVLQSKAQEDYEPNVQLLVDQGAALVVGVGFMMENAVEAVARRNPTAKLLIIDSPILNAKGEPTPLPNVRSVIFHEEQGSFLVGALAGLTTKSGSVGFVGGMEIPLIKKFEAGFRAGLQTVNPTAASALRVTYTGSFDNVGAGKQVGQDLLAKGVDVIFHAAGTDGLGVIQATKEARSTKKDAYVIGVDSDQWHVAPDAVLSSMVKRVDLAVYDACKDLVDGKWTAGEQALGLKEGGVSYAEVRAPLPNKPELMQKVEALRQRIVAGEISVPSPALIQLSHISKSFGRVRALDDVSLELRLGELVALVGENGAGKSSLMNVLYGLYQPDQGELSFDGQRLRLRGPKDAIAHGIGMVHQHFMLVPNLTVAENVVLGREPTRRGILDLAAARAQVEETCGRFGFQLDPGARISELTVGSQQKVEIVKALHRGAKVLILDEPTAVLTPQEADELFRVCKGLTAEGHAVVLISHKLKEVLALAQRIHVMRRGKLVASVAGSETNAEQLAQLMVGDAETSAPPPSAAGSAPEATVLDLYDVHAGPRLKGATLRVNAGEIVGIAGVDGNGQRELAEVVVGLRPVDTGELRLCGGAAAKDPADARRRGVAHVPEDRLRRGMVGTMRVEENVALGRQAEAPFAKGPWIDFAGRRERTLALLTAYDVRPNDPQVRMAGLSGGNQQKVVFARELDAQPKLLVAVQPTRGLDVAAVAAVRRRLLEEKARGAGVLLISLDLDEVLALSDRIYAMFEGRVAGERPRGADERELGRLMLGGAAHG